MLQFWEPYTVVARVDADGHRLPRYHEPYIGRHRNKVDFVSSLRSERYRFYTLLREYLVHLPHPLAEKGSDADDAVIFREMVALYMQRRERLGRFFNRTNALAADKHTPSPWDAAGFSWPLEQAGSPLF